MELFSAGWFQLPLQNTHNQLEGKTKVNVFVCFIWVHRTTKIMIMLGVFRPEKIGYLDDRQVLKRNTWCLTTLNRGLRTGKNF